MKTKENILSGIVKKSFDKIDDYHKKNHISQIDSILEYQKALFSKKISLIKFLSDVLEFEEKIFWCIDDVIDNQYNDQMTVMYNEIVKFVSFIEMFDRILDYQLKNKGDFSKIILNKGIIAEKILSSIKNNLMDIVNIPYNEEKITEKILGDIDKKAVISLIAENQLNRAQNVKIYLGTAEAICGNKINYKPFLLLREMQLLRGDLEDIEEDEMKNNNNSFNMLMKKYKDPITAKRMILSVAENILKELSLETDKKSEFILYKARKEEDAIKHILNEIK